MYSTCTVYANLIPKLGVRHVGILPSQILSKHSVEPLQMTLRDPTGPRKPPPILPDAWIASGRDFPEVDVKGEVSILLGPISCQKWPRDVLSFHDCCVLTIHPHWPLAGRDH